uniref:Ephrin A4 n=1 Tax=Chelydra serpentina TaxID=8475 RepID=A0A8C3SB71_CHESE
MARPALPQLLLSVWLQDPHPSAQAGGSEPTGSAGTCQPLGQTFSGCWVQRADGAVLSHGSVPTHWPLLSPRFLHEDYAVQVSINDYLDVYCPHYERPVPAGRAETFSLHMVDAEGYRGCYETPGAFKRWECNRPHAPFGPVRFSEKIQRFTPFSLGFEFQPGETYYYICDPESAGRCLRLQVTVCCKATSESGRLGTGGGCMGGGAGPPTRQEPANGTQTWGGHEPGGGETALPPPPPLPCSGGRPGTPCSGGRAALSGGLKVSGWFHPGH